MLQQLVDSFISSITARFSDDPSVLSRDEKAYKNLLESQSEFTAYDVQLEAHNQFPDFIIKPRETGK
jgi:hypothetical protein